MTPEDALKLARQVADEHTEANAVAQSPNDVQTEFARSETADWMPVGPHPFLHDREMRDAVRIVNRVASGRNPFSDHPFEELRQEHRDLVLQALCVVVSSFVGRGAQEPPRRSDTFAAPARDEDRSSKCPQEVGGVTASSPAPFGDQGPSGKRPLEEYLQRVEREAILEALVETRYNRTAAARLLGITFRALRYRMENLGLCE